MKLKTQFFFLGLILSILPLAFVSSTLISSYQSELNQVVIDELHNVTVAQIDIIDEFFNERDIDMGILTDYAMLHRLIEQSGPETEKSEAYTEDRQIMEKIFQVQKNRKPYIHSITALNTDFRILVSTEETGPDEISTIGQFELLKDLGHKAKFSNIVEAGEFGTRNRCLVAVKGIYDEKDSLIGYIIEEISLEFFEELRISAKLLTAGTIYISDGAGGLITAGTENTSRQEYVLDNNERGTFSEAWEKRGRSEQTGIISYTIKDKHYVTCYGSFNNAGWQILSTVCMNEILHTGDSLLRILILCILVTATLTFMTNLIMRRMVSEPIEQIAGTFKDIRKNKDFSRRIENFPHNEVGVIAGEINNLLEDIEITLSQQAQRLKILKEQAERDPLTRLFNKKSIQDVWSLKCENARVSKGMLACVLVDIDDFKSFNTRFGHFGGDAVIRFITAYMQELSGDMAGRIGGDEFIMFLDFSNDREEAEACMEKFMDFLQTGMDLDGSGTPVSIPCSAGMALFDRSDPPSFSCAVEAADKAMYSVKNEKKNGFTIWS